jgi:hypothetical protein
MTVSTHSASSKLAALALLFVAAAAAAQVNPHTGIKWPPCTGTHQVYSIVTNTCIDAGGGGGGGASPNPPDYSIQFAIGALFGSDPNIKIDPTLHAINVGAPTANPTYHMKPLGTITADWTFDVASPQTAIDSLMPGGVDSYVWTFHLGHGAWQPSSVAGVVTSIVEGTGITCTPFSGGKCVGDVTINATGSATAFSAITSAINTAAAMQVGSGASMTPTGTGKITATHTTQTGLTQCLQSLTDGTISGTGAACTSATPGFNTIAGGTNNSGAAMIVGSSSSLGHSGSGTIDATAVNGVAVSGTPSAGQVPTATDSAHATWQTPGSGVTTTCNANGCYQVGSDGSLLEWGTVTATGSGTGGTFTITLPFAMTTTTNQWVQAIASYCNLGSPGACAGGSGGSNASTPTAGLETASTTAPTMAWWDANTAPGTIAFTWTARGK